jgi:osmoprotectant transport system ATP-binding protein
MRGERIIMIELKNVTKSFDGKNKVVKNLNLKIEKGEFVVLIGESGCGKTTTMKMINLLEKPTKGEIFIDGENVKGQDLMELRRNIGYVIQKVGLFPHMTIGENIELVPTLKKWSKEEKKARAFELLELMDLPAEDFYYRYPSELSGGQQQRIGIARALAVNPEIILMDEPFSALDPITREKLQDEMTNLQEELGKTIVFVTHDMDEALKLADKIAVIKDGEVIQFDTPEEILKNPKNDFVEYFFGKDRMWKTPEMLLAKDIMKKKFGKIGVNGSSARAIEIMKERETNTLIVVDREGEKKQKPVGVVTRNMIMKNNGNSVKMREIMASSANLIVDENTNMVEVLNIMSKVNFRSIPIVDKDKLLVGAITPISLLNIITEISPSIEGGE